MLLERIEKTVFICSLLVGAAVPIACADVHESTAEKSDPSKAISVGVSQEMLEQSWSGLQQAIAAGDEAKFARWTSSYFYGKLKNDYAAAGVDFDADALQSNPYGGLDLASMKFVELFENGATAGLLYAVEVEEESHTFFFVKFVNEDARWRIDAMIQGRFEEPAGDAPARFDPNHFDPLGDSRFKMDGMVREAPAPLAADAVLGILDVLSYGYRTKVVLNGAQELVSEDRQDARRVELTVGENRLELSFEPTGESDASVPTVKVSARRAGEEWLDLLEFSPENGGAGSHEMTFRIE